MEHRIPAARLIIPPPTLSSAERTKLRNELARAAEAQRSLAATCQDVLPCDPLRDCEDGWIVPHAAAHSLPPVHAVQRAPLEIGSLLTVGASLIRAVAALSGRRVVHGGIALSTLYVDPAGRVRLGDVGIAAAFERALGPGCRQRLCIAQPSAAEREHIRAIGGFEVSGIWQWSDEPNLHADWVGVYRAPEITMDRTPAQLRTDLFALGVALWALTTGAHPYDVPWDEPDFGFHLLAAPRSLADARPDWSQALGRVASGLGAAADRPIAAWHELLLGLLQLFPEARRLESQPILSLASQQLEAAAIPALLGLLGDAPELVPAKPRPGRTGGRARSAASRSRVHASKTRLEPPPPRESPKPSARPARLEVARADGRITHVSLSEGEPFIIGRQKSCGLALPEDAWVSRRHVRLELRNGELCVDDLGSRHGTKLNGRPLGPATRLRAGDELVVGVTRLRLCGNGKPQS